MTHLANGFVWRGRVRSGKPGSLGASDPNRRRVPRVVFNPCRLGRGEGSRVEDNPWHPKLPVPRGRLSAPDATNRWGRPGSFGAIGLTRREWLRSARGALLQDVGFVRGIMSSLT